MPKYIKPSPTITKVNFVATFDDDFSLILRERKSITLVAIHKNAIEVEANRAISRNLRAKLERAYSKMTKQEATYSSEVKE